MKQFKIRIVPPGLEIRQRGSSSELAVRSALHFHGAQWRKGVKDGFGSVECYESPCHATYDRLIFTPDLSHNGKRIYRADPFTMIREGTKTTTVRRRGPKGAAGDPLLQFLPSHNIGDLLEAAQGGMRSGLIIEIMDVPEWDAETITPEMAYNDGFTGDAAGAQLMASFVAGEGGPMDLYVFRFREDLSFLPEVRG